MSSQKIMSCITWMKILQHLQTTKTNMAYICAVCSESSSMHNCSVNPGESGKNWKLIVDSETQMQRAFLLWPLDYFLMSSLTQNNRKTFEIAQSEWVIWVLLHISSKKPFCIELKQLSSCSILGLICSHIVHTVWFSIFYFLPVVNMEELTLQMLACVSGHILLTGNLINPTALRMAKTP